MLSAIGGGRGEEPRGPRSAADEETGECTPRVSADASPGFSAARRQGCNYSLSRVSRSWSDGVALSLFKNTRSLGR